MKAHQILILAIALAASMASCSKDDDPVATVPPAPTIYGEENPFFAFVSRMPNSDTFIDALEGPAQTGYIFKAIQKGKINSLVVKIPATNSALKVFIWDTATLALIRSEVVNVSEAGVEITKDITPVEIQKDKEYLITIYTDDYYFHSTNNFSAISYPIDAGNIQILQTRSGYGELCPQTGGSSNGYSGDVSFKFQRTE